jgi:hypothetical protein
MTGRRPLGAKVKNWNSANCSWYFLINMYLRIFLVNKSSIGDPSLHVGRQLGTRVLEAFQLYRARHQCSALWYPRHSNAVPSQGRDSNQPVLLPVLNFHQLMPYGCKLPSHNYYSQPHVLSHVSRTDNPFWQITRVRVELGRSFGPHPEHAADPPLSRSLQSLHCRMKSYTFSQQLQTTFFDHTLATSSSYRKRTI